MPGEDELEDRRQGTQLEPVCELTPARSKKIYSSYVPSLPMNYPSKEMRTWLNFLWIQSSHCQSQCKCPSPPPVFSDFGVSNRSYSSSSASSRDLIILCPYSSPSHQNWRLAPCPLEAYSFSTLSAPCNVRWLVGNCTIFLRVLPTIPPVRGARWLWIGNSRGFMKFSSSPGHLSPGHASPGHLSYHTPSTIVICRLCACLFLYPSWGIRSISQHLAWNSYPEHSLQNLASWLKNFKLSRHLAPFSFHNYFSGFRKSHFLNLSYS